MAILRITNDLYLFEGTQYRKYQTGSGDDTPIECGDIATGFGLPFAGIDAALEGMDGKIFFFSGMQYVRYDWENRKVEAGYPRIIPFNWRGLWASDLNAAVRVGTKAYFFKRADYIRYDLPSDVSDWGYPQSIAASWPGLPDTVEGAVFYEPHYLVFFRENTCWLYDGTRDRVTSSFPLADLLRYGIGTFAESDYSAE